MQQKTNTISDNFRPKMLPMAEFALMLVERTMREVEQLRRELADLSR